MELTAASIIDLLELEPLTFEGGYFRRTYLSSETRSINGQEKPLGSAIYYLLTPDSYSRIHRLPHDEIFHFYLGDPVEMMTITDEGEVHIIHLGPNLSIGHQPQVIVPGNIWQGCRLIDGGRFALLGTTMAPAFEESDFQAPDSVDILLRNTEARFHNQIRDLM